MQRAIKFRVRNGAMVLGWEIFSNGRWYMSKNNKTGRGAYLDGVFNGIAAERDQYTGLKDKNGVEIYEGDLVKTSYHTNKVSHYGLVDWVDYGFGIRRRDTTTSKKLQVFGAAPLPDSSRIEVIGNIYENPELLEANQ